MFWLDVSHLFIVFIVYRRIACTWTQSSHQIFCYVEDLGDFTLYMLPHNSTFFFLWKLQSHFGFVRGLPHEQSPQTGKQGSNPSAMTTLTAAIARKRSRFWNKCKRGWVSCRSSSNPGKAVEINAIPPYFPPISSFELAPFCFKFLLQSQIHIPSHVEWGIYVE